MSRNQNTPQQDSVEARPVPTTFDATSAAVISSWVATVLACCYVMSRLGFGVNSGPVAKALGASYFLLLWPRVFRQWRRTRSRQPSPASWISSQAGVLLLTLTGLVAAGAALRFIDVNLSFVIPATGFGLALYEWRRFLSEQGAGRSLAIGAGVIVFAAWSFATYHLGRDPLFLERLQASGDTSIDTLFHAAISNMLKTYGTVSTGLDGLLFGAYHFGSHWLFAQLSSLLRISSLTFYLVGFQIIIVPLFINCIVLFAVEVSARLERRRLNVWPWAVLAIATVGYTYLDSISATRNETIVQSESLSVSMIFLFIAGTLALQSYDDVRSHEGRASLHDRVFWFVVFPLLLSASGLSKISTLTMTAVAFAYIFVRLRLYRSWLFRIAFAILVLAGLGVSAIFMDPSARLEIVPFDYVKHYVMPDALLSGRLKIALFVVFRFLGMWVLLALVCRDAILRRRDPARRRPPVLAAQIAVILAVVCVTPGLIWAFAAGAAGYFLAVQTWIALAFVMAIGPDGRPDTASSPPSSRMVRTLRAAGRAIVVLVVFAELANLASGPVLAFVKQNAAIRTSILMGDPRNEAKVSAFPADFDAVIHARRWRESARLVSDRWLLRGGSRYVDQNPVQILQTLQRLGDLPLSERRHSLLFIPRTNRLFWGGRQRNHLANNVTAAEMPNFLYGGGGLNLSCDTLPFLVPALTGMAMLDGLPEAPCRATAYLYADSYLAREGKPLFTLDSDDAYRRAVEAGDSQLIVLEDVGGKTVLRKMSAR